MTAEEIERQKIEIAKRDANTALKRVPNGDRAELRDPMPDVQEFIRRYGGFAKVPPEAWREWDRMNARWQAQRSSITE